MCGGGEDIQAEGLATPGSGTGRPYLSRTQWSLELQLALAGHGSCEEEARQGKGFGSWVCRQRTADKERTVVGKP